MVKQDCLLPGQAQLYQGVSFLFFHPKVKVKETKSLTFFGIWGVVWSEGVKKCIQGLLAKVVFYLYPALPTPIILPGRGLAKKNQNHSLKMHFHPFEAFLANVIFYPPPHTANWGGGLFDYGFYPVLPFEILNSQRVGIPSFPPLKSFLVGWGGVVILIICSVKPGLHFVKVKARFVQVGD